MPERAAAVVDSAPARPPPRHSQFPPRARRILGFDYGLKRIGVAVGNTATATAQPLPSVAARAGEPDWAALQKHIDDWRPDALAVGLPLHMDGGESGMSRRARAFGRRAGGRFGLAVVFVDERLTTRAAEEYLQAAIAETKRKRAPGNTVRAAPQVDRRHGIAAQLIVQAYIDQSARTPPSSPSPSPDLPADV